MKKKLAVAPIMSKEERALKSSFAPYIKKTSKEMNQIMKLKQKIKAVKLSEQLAKQQKTTVKQVQRAIKRQKLVDKILELRRDIKQPTLIAKKLKVSTQYIYLIKKTLFTEAQKKEFDAVRPFLKGRRVDPITVKCPVCKKKFQKLPSGVVKTCSRSCGADLKRKWKKLPKSIKGNAINTWLYNNDKNYKKFHAKQMSDWYKKMRKDPVKLKNWTDKNKIYTKRYQEKLKYGKPKTKLQ